MVTHQDILLQLEMILQRMQSACVRVGRSPDEVRLLLATKTVSADRIQVALQAGQTLMGENKVQEIKEKFDALSGTPHETHFIGHLQTNKIKDILKYDVSCVQSLDRLDLAEKLNEKLQQAQRTLDVLIQVNTSGEVSKFGIHPEEAIALTRQVAKLPHLRVKGLMTIGLFSAEMAQVRPCFRLLRHLKEEISTLEIPNVSMCELSMGMSGDLEVAIEEGATIVRVGTAIFGQRVYPDSYYWNEAGKS